MRSNESFTLRNSPHATAAAILVLVFGQRLGTLHELTKLAPVAILAEALGYHPTTIERHAVDSATAYSRYVAAVRGG